MTTSLPTPLITLIGPTAVGKTALSLRLAQRFDGEILSADSRQIYRGMDIGTAKPTPAERAQIPHHLLDLRNPDEPLSLAQFQSLAYATIDAVHARGRVPLLVGGTALYQRAIVEGLRIPEVPPDAALRARMEALLASEGREALFGWLQRIDPATAAQIDPLNPRRVMRAIEIYESTGQSKVELEGSEPPPYRILQIGLQREREALYQRIDERVDAMIEAGLVAETQRLLDAGYAANLPAMTSLGYREISAFLRGELAWDDAVARIKTETHRFVRHQSTWFRRMKNVHWFQLDADRDAPTSVQAAADVEALVASFLRPASIV